MPTVFVGSKALVNPRVRDVVSAVSPEAGPRTDTDGLGSGGTAHKLLSAVWPALAVSAVFAILWALLAARSPSTTFHLAPFLVGGASVLTRGRRPGESAAWSVATAPVGGFLVAAITTVALASAGLLRGSGLTGHAAPATEAIIAAALGAGIGQGIGQGIGLHRARRQSASTAES